MPMENPFTAYGKGRAFPTGTANRFPTATPDMAVYTHSHNAYYGDYPSDPILHGEKEKKGQKKEWEHSPRTNRESCAPVLRLEQCAKINLLLRVLEKKGQQRKS